jgi:hypothetical protein
LTNSGGQIQVIKMTPPEMQNQNKNWTNRSVQAKSAATSATAQMGAAYMFGFQL